MEHEDEVEPGQSSVAPLIAEDIPSEEATKGRIEAHIQRSPPSSPPSPDDFLTPATPSNSVDTFQASNHSGLSPYSLHSSLISRLSLSEVSQPMLLTDFPPSSSSSSSCSSSSSSSSASPVAPFPLEPEETSMDGADKTLQTTSSAPESSIHSTYADAAPPPSDLPSSVPLSEIASDQPNQLELVP